MESRPHHQLPLKPVEVMILVILAERDLHGYGLVKAMEERSNGAVRLEPGNLYRVLRRLESRGLVRKGASAPTPESGDERRRYHAITEAGRRTLAAETDRMRRVVRDADRALGRA